MSKPVWHMRTHPVIQWSLWSHCDHCDHVMIFLGWRWLIYGLLSYLSSDLWMSWNGSLRCSWLPGHLKRHLICSEVSKSEHWQLIFPKCYGSIQKIFAFGDARPPICGTRHSCSSCATQRSLRHFSAYAQSHWVKAAKSLRKQRRSEKVWESFWYLVILILSCDIYWYVVIPMIPMLKSWRCRVICGPSHEISKTVTCTESLPKSSGEST